MIAVLRTRRRVYPIEKAEELYRVLRVACVDLSDDEVSSEALEEQRLSWVEKKVS